MLSIASVAESKHPLKGNLYITSLCSDGNGKVTCVEGGRNEKTIQITIYTFITKLGCRSHK
jgi:hypothetical protein